MGYLGTQAPTGFKTTTKQSFSGDNSTTAFTLNRASSSSTDLEVFVDNIQQEPTTAYSVSGTTLTFTEAPPTGTNNIYVVNRGGDQNGLLPPQDLGTTDYIFGDDVSFNSDSAKLNFGADSEITITHVADTGLNLKHTATGDDKPIVLTLQTGETDIAADDVIGKINFQAPDEGTGTDAILVAAGIQAISEGDFSSSVNATSLQFMTGASEAATAKASITSGGDVKVLTDGASIFFGADSEIELRHVADDGLILKHVGTADGKEPSLTFQAGDNDIAQDDVLGSIFFQAPDEGAGTDAILVAAGIEAVSEGDFSSSSNATSLVFKTGASEAATEQMRINSAGRVGIGTTDIDAALDIVDSVEYVRISSTTSDDTTKTGGLAVRHRDNEEEDFNVINGVSGSSANIVNIGGSDFIGSLNAATSIQFFTAANRTTTDGTQRMQIDSSGRLLVGTTSTLIDTDQILQVKAAQACNFEATVASADGGSVINLERSGNTQGDYIRLFNSSNAETGQIRVDSGGTTQFENVSDYRLKDNIKDWDVDASAKVKQVKIKTFDWKDQTAQTNGKGLVGVIAHELQEVYPHCVSGEKDGYGADVDKDGNKKPMYQGVDYGKLTPLLTKALQEALARIDTLETKVKTLEGG